MDGDVLTAARTAVSSAVATKVIKSLLVLRSLLCCLYFIVMLVCTVYVHSTWPSPALEF
jgi:hypothetical protein